MSHNSRQQVVRVDREPEPLGEMHPALLNLVNAAREYATASDAFLVSDYGYGAATPRLLTFIKSNGCLENKPVTVDSRYRMLDYEGVTAATPNEPEVEEALGIKIGHDDEKLFGAGERLLQEMALESLVITRGRDGMVAFEKDTPPLIDSDIWFRPGGGCDRRRRHRDCDLHRGTGGGRRYRGGDAAGELRRRHRGDEARHGHGLEPGIAGGHRPVFDNYIFVSDHNQKILSRDSLARARGRLAPRRRADRAGQWLL